MRYVIRNKQSGWFLRSSGQWTKLLGEAERFPNGLSVALHLESAGAIQAREQIEILRLPSI